MRRNLKNAKGNRKLCETYETRRFGIPVRLALLLAISVALVGCGRQSQQSAVLSAEIEAQNDGARLYDVIAAKFPPERLGSEEDRLAAARELISEHEKRRASAGVPALSPEARDFRITALADHPVSAARNAKAQRVAQRVDAAIASLSGKAIREGDIVRIATLQVEEEQPGLNGSDKRRAAEQATKEIRAKIETQHHSKMRSAINERETELTRLAGLNLANMPQEISKAAEQNLIDSRSPIDASPSWRPTRAAVQTEEIRLRTAIANRIEANVRAAEAASRAAAEASRREAIIQQCRMQAALAGASVPTPYAGRTMGSALAAGLLGAIQQASTEENARVSCLQAAGY